MPLDGRSEKLGFKSRKILTGPDIDVLLKQLLLKCLRASPLYLIQMEICAARIYLQTRQTGQGIENTLPLSLNVVPRSLHIGFVIVDTHGGFQRQGIDGPRLFVSLHGPDKPC